MPRPPESLERLDTTHGVVAIVELVDDEAVAAALAALPSAERAYALTLAEVRRREHVAGRTALHALLRELAPSLASAPILADDRGAPVLPAGWHGSISHKGTRAAALVAPAGDARVGIDLELAQPPRADIARRILTARERTLEIDGRGTTLRFSIKEAIYKAVDPFVRRYVGFTEVELEVVEGLAHVTTELPFAIETTWREHAGFWLTTARAARR
ncbi:MAG TPA: 4'-phosphopantetheinyl transferase superfamily protein [Kofleriaceae bacterium]|nr:4'-phosphopantetheinyl transferase superfamily protein [Kofleriaceae bacterium]